MPTRLAQRCNVLCDDLLLAEELLLFCHGATHVGGWPEPAGVIALQWEKQFG